MLGRLPYAAVGTGAPVVVLAGLSPTTGVDGEWLMRGSLAPFGELAADHRVFLINRRPNLPQGMTMSELAHEHADALAAGFDEHVDVIGTSTGGSIAQQLAAEHPGVVDRLALVSTACRLDPATRRWQAQVAAHVRADEPHAAARLLAAGLVPTRAGRAVAGAAGWLLGPKLVPDRQSWLDLATTIEAEDSFDLRTCSARIASPALIVAGAHDRFYGRDLFDETARLIPDARLLVVPRRGHITVLNDRTTKAALATFLSTSRGSTQ